MGEERNARRLKPGRGALVSLLDRKLLRDILAMRGQVMTIALVVAAGIAVFVASISTYDSLRRGVIASTQTSALRKFSSR